MQNKGAIRLFAIIFALICVYQLSFTVVTNLVERNAKDYAQSESAFNLARQLAKGDAVLEGYYLDSISKSREASFLDSMKSEVVYNIGIDQYTYQEAKEREINLGLDLKGGMNVVLEVSVGDIIRALSNNSQDPVFLQAMDRAFERQKESSESFITLFGEEFSSVDPNASLAAIFLYEFRDKGININSTNEEVLQVLSEETEGAIDRSFQILRTRIDRFGVAQPNIQRLSTSGRILVELPGIKEPERVRKLLQGTAKLEFFETHNFNELYSYFDEANAQLKKVLEDEGILISDEQTALPELTDEGDELTIAEEDPEKQDALSSLLEDENQDVSIDTSDLEIDTSENSLLEELASDTTIAEDQSFEAYAKNNPLYAYLMPGYVQDESGRYFPAQSARVGSALVKDTARINYMLRKVHTIFPRNVRLSWTVKPDPQNPNVLDLVALKVNPRDNAAAMSGDVISDARQDFDPNGRVEVTLNMNAEGAKEWKRLTGDNIGRSIAIVLDDYVYSYPTVNSEIAGGRSSISGGGMTVEEAQDLANILKAGKLPAPARIVEEAVVGPSLGREAVSAGLYSFILAFGMVLLYMILYYNRAGLVANIALLTNIFFLFGVLASFGAVLTLPGIAGIVLTLGMAVDANVIIYERIKEEVRAGKGVRLAIADGYKNAYSAIIDGNVTTLLTGIVLYIFGTGPVQGFATTLIIGILSSLFSAIFITRLVFTSLLDRNAKVTFSNKRTENFLANTHFNFLGKRRIAYVISTVIIVIGLASLFTRGLNFGIDFTGGRTYVIRFDKDVNTDDIRNTLSEAFDNISPEVKTFGPDRQVKISTKFLIDDDRPEVDSIIQTRLFNGLKQYYEEDINYFRFSSDNEDENKLLGILSSQKVGPTIADDIRNKAILAISFALILIFIYIALRFKYWQYGLAGVAALFHDTLITLGLFSLFYGILPFNMEVDQAFIAAILTIIGYSINDTVIIFDRIREFRSLHPKRKLIDNMNDALNSTLARTVNTSGTTLVVLLMIFIFGGEIIRGFVFALLVGILIGTYSSLFTASPIAYDLLKGAKRDAEIDMKAAKQPGKKNKK